MKNRMLELTAQSAGRPSSQIVILRGNSVGLNLFHRTQLVVFLAAWRPLVNMAACLKMSLSTPV